MSTESLNETVPAVEVTHSPTTLSSAAAVVAALFGALAGGAVSLLALLFCLLGVVGIAGSLFGIESRRGVSVGVAVLFFGVLLGGLLGNSGPFLIVATIGTILAFDLGHNAFSLGEQMSDDTSTSRGELVHAAASLLIGLVASVVTYLIYLLSASGVTTAALTFVLLAAIALIWTFRT